MSSKNCSKVKCLNPRKAWICGLKVCKADGVLSQHLVFSPKEAYHYFYNLVQTSLLRPDYGRHQIACDMMKEHETEVCCGQCACCQISKRKDMATRLAQESSQWENSCFITLTYNEDSVPCITSEMVNDEKGIKQAYEIQRGCDWDYPVMTLLPSDVQKFIKRLRRHLEYVPKIKKDGRDHCEHLRYFAVGEYGSKTHRPHYHILIFGWTPSDIKLEFIRPDNGTAVFTSAQLQKLWPFGYSSVTSVNAYVAKYAARYVTKKYARLNDTDIKEIKVPEFVLQSTRNGAMGSTWFDKFGEMACKVGYTTYRVGERICKAVIPKYYWNRLRRRNLPLWLECRDEKIEFVKNHKDLCFDIADLERQSQVQAYKDKCAADRETF